MAKKVKILARSESNPRKKALTYQKHDLEAKDSSLVRLLRATAVTTPKGGRITVIGLLLLLFVIAVVAIAAPRSLLFSSVASGVWKMIKMIYVKPPSG